VHALAHITGGGLLENIPRVLPDNAKAMINLDAWQRPAIFDWLQKGGNIDEHEMHRTLNCGVGMVICVPASSVDAALVKLADNGEIAFVLGDIQPMLPGDEQVELLGLRQ
jgi:phosphoribosylformylglycinamidine cyclo-ligase